MISFFEKNRAINRTPDDAPLHVTRRSLLKAVTVAGAALIVPVGFAVGQPPKKKDENPFTEWIRVDANGQVTIFSARSEMGQGISSALPMVLADEMEVDWKDVQIEQALNSLGTGGSGSLAGSWMSMRQSGAAARLMLTQAAAERWKVSPEACTAKNGAIWHEGQSLKYGELVEAASKLPLPDFSTLKLKLASEFQVIGTEIPRKDIPGKTDGSAKFGLDVRVPGMVYAMVERCPVFGGKVKSFDASKAKAIPGVLDVFDIPAVDEGVHSWGGVVVVAESTWIASKARKALAVQWDPGPHATESTDSLRKQFRRIVDTPQKEVLNTGNADAAISAAPQDKKVAADYECPFQAHACMEPMNCTVSITADSAEAWAPAQGPEWVKQVLSQVSGLPDDKVKVHVTLMGGGFGRRYQADFAMEAAQIAKKVGKPVQLVWTREDDMTHDYYRPASYHRMSGALDNEGNIVAWKHRSTSTPIAVFWNPKSPPESSEMGCTMQMPYLMKHYRLEFAPAESGVPRAWWRSVEASTIGFVMESYMDELAHAAGADPYQFRLKHLDASRKVVNPKDAKEVALDCARMRGVLKLAAEKSDWGAKLPAGQGRGIACHYSFHSYVAAVAEVTVADGKVRVNRIVSAVDIGTPVSPNGIRGQVESAIVYGLTAALKSQITIANGRAVEANFNKFDCLRMLETPKMEVYIVPSNLAPTGIGEPGLPPTAPAVMNAIFAATGKRIRRLPLMPEDLRA
jgi:isoquinoline 1-oxidoreductase beta subunit